MASSEASADVYLTEWLGRMQDENPLKRVVWLVPGAKEGESMVVHHMRVLKDNLVEKHPDAETMLYTTCRNVEGWSEGSYIVEHESGGHVFQAAHRVVQAMHFEEGGFRPDMYVCSGLSTAFLVYGAGLVFLNEPRPPVLCVNPKVAEENWAYEQPNRALDLLPFLFNIETFYHLALDNRNEVCLLQDLMLKSGAQARDSQVRRARTYAFEGYDLSQADKQEVVVWSGRASKMKNPDLGAQVFSFLTNVQREVFIPNVSGAAGTSAWRTVEGVTLHVNESPAVYREMTARAKVLLVTSFAEGYGVGYIELWGQGCVPVVWDRPWARDLLPADWPLFFKTPGDGVEKVYDALENWEKYVRLLMDWMPRRFPALDFAEQVEGIWEEYTVQLGDRIRLVSNRGSWRCL